MKNHSVASCATLIILPKSGTYEIASRTKPLRLQNKSRVSPNLHLRKELQSVTSRKIKQSAHHQRGLCLKKSIKQLRRSFNQKLKSIDQHGALTDMVRYLQEKQQTIDPFKLPEDSPGDRTARYVYGETRSGLGSLQSARLDWDEEDTKLIDEALSKYEKCPRNPEITKVFSSTPQLQKNLRR